MKHIIYFHGFGSALNGPKVLALKEHFKVFSPKVPFEFDLDSLYSQVGEYLYNETKVGNDVLFVGTSLGGYFATILSEAYDGKFLVFNPVVDPYASLKKFVGECQNFSTNESFNFTESMLKSFEGKSLYDLVKEQNGKAIVCARDTVVDPELSYDFYKNAVLVDSDDHQFTNMKMFLNEVSK